MKEKYFILPVIMLCIFYSCSSSNDTEENEVIAPFLRVSDFISSINESPSADYILDSLSIETNIDSIKVSILSQWPEGAFKITNNKLELNQIALFDYEFYKEVTAELEVTGENFTKKMDVVVTINDKNESPHIFANNFVFKNKSHRVNKLRDLSDSNYKKIHLASPGVEFYSSIGLNGYGEFFSFEFEIPVEINQKDIIDYEVSNSVYSIVIALNNNFEEINSKNFPIEYYHKVKSSKIIFKKQASLNEYSNYYEINFLFFLEDGLVVSGQFFGMGLDK